MNSMLIIVLLKIWSFLLKTFTVDFDEIYICFLRCFCNVIFQGSTCYWLRGGVFEPPWYFKAFVWSGSHKSMDHIAFILPYPHLIVCVIISPYITTFFFCWHHSWRKHLRGSGSQPSIDMINAFATGLRG